MGGRRRRTLDLHVVPPGNLVFVRDWPEPAQRNAKTLDRLEVIWDRGGGRWKMEDGGKEMGDGSSVMVRVRVLPGHINTRQRSGKVSWEHENGAVNNTYVRMDGNRNLLNLISLRDCLTLCRDVSRCHSLWGLP